ncbi:hypothetical protein [Rhizobium sp. RAF56]|uniref:hypothetical protein n=1 Tax=Rhizobium sp. RAF56 TaxID=3233062 RepID=UPI003F9B2550
MPSKASSVAAAQLKTAGFQGGTRHRTERRSHDLDNGRTFLDSRPRMETVARHGRFHSMSDEQRSESKESQTREKISFAFDRMKIASFQETFRAGQEATIATSSRRTKRLVKGRFLDASYFIDQNGKTEAGSMAEIATGVAVRFRCGTHQFATQATDNEAGLSDKALTKRLKSDRKLRTFGPVLRLICPTRIRIVP